MTATRSPATTPPELMQTFAALAATGRLDELVALYEPDAVFQPEFGVELRGHEQIRPALAEFLSLQPQITYHSTPDVVIVGDLALVSNHWTMTGTAPDGSPVNEGGVSADLCRRRADGSWGVLIDQPRGEHDS